MLVTPQNSTTKFFFSSVCGDPEEIFLTSTFSYFLFFAAAALPIKLKLGLQIGGGRLVLIANHLNESL
jgi:hypothetical protein